MLRIDNGDWRRATATDSDVELVFVVVITHLGGASSEKTESCLSCARLPNRWDFAFVN